MKHVTQIKQQQQTEKLVLNKIFSIKIPKFSSFINQTRCVNIQFKITNIKNI